jgi:transcription antitermination protein NusB
VPSSERRQARERALSLLYEAETKSQSPSALVAEQVLEPDDFTVDVVQGVEASGPEIDALITRFAKNWPLARMPALDRTLLRMGVYELTHRADVPTGVVLSEIVDLASIYSTDESGPFVNGVLAAIAAEVRGGVDGDPAVVEQG